MYKQILANTAAVREAAATSNSLGQALDQLGIVRGGKTYKAFIAVCEANGIDYSFPSKYLSKMVPLKDILIDNSPYVNNRIVVKDRVIAAGLLEYVCALCGQLPEWNGRPLVLQLDHINGKNNDHRIENLRILCPNCHTQTETYAGKRRK